MTIAATPTTRTTVRINAAPAPATSPVSFDWFEYEGSEPLAEQLRHDEFLNPILAGCYPDPSICRVGDNFFLVNSTFAWYPGIPIFRSKDLVNWTQLGHVLDRPSQVDLDSLAVSEGIFAPTIHHHAGTFYVITTLVGRGGNFYVTAKDPAGPWSEPIWLKDVHGIDPAFFFDDDGKAYIVHNGGPPDNKPLYSGHRALWMHEFDPASGTTRAGSAKIIVNGGTDLAQKPVWIEGPHLVKRSGYYYLCAAEGGTGPVHCQVIFRSRSVWGPYEPFKQPILTQRHLPDARTNPVTCTGHADLVQTPAGEWWAVFLACRPYKGAFTNIGRETFLLPVRWEDDWPNILQGPEPVPLVLKRPNLPPQETAPLAHHGSFKLRDDFDSQNLSPVWNFLRTLRQQWHWLDRKPGSLLIEPRLVALNSRSNPSLIARRQQHHNFSAAASMTPSDNAQAESGLVAFQNETHYFFLGVRLTRQGSREIFLERAARKQSPGKSKVVARADLPAQLNSIELKISGRASTYSFAYRIPDRNWTPLVDADGTILSNEVAGGFVGTYIGMFARVRE
jgi:xylan 1,4-beta-xylosidase